MKATRRQLVRWLGRGAAAAMVSAGQQSPGAIGRARPKVVIVGGGPGGATVARYLALHGGQLDITLVEAKSRYTTCFFSNLYLGGLRTYDSITQGYEHLSSAEGVAVVQDTATALDPGTRRLRLRSGASLPYDRLVIAPGVDFRYDAVGGYDETSAETMPHAWRAGTQTRRLKQQIESMDDGGLVIIAPPQGPYRCPPGPYERASMIAYYLKRTKPASKILILDSKNSFSKQSLFLEAWERYYAGMIEWIPASFTGGVKKVDAKAYTVSTSDETFEPAVANIIPPQTAGQITQQLDLADDSGWCPVDPATLESRLRSGIHLVGDAIIPGDMPKSAYSANSQAKVCAMAVASELIGSERFPARFRNTCWSHLTEDDVVKIGADYRVKDGQIRKIDGFVSQVGESMERRAQAASEARGWYKGFVKDVFG